MKNKLVTLLAIPTTLALHLSPVFAEIVNPVLDRYGNDSQGAASGSLLLVIISAVLSFIMVIAALLVLLNLVEGGIAWISSGGESSKLQKARDRMLHAVIGIIILSASVAVWGAVRQFLGISLDFKVLFPGYRAPSSAGVGAGSRTAPTGSLGDELRDNN